MDPDADYWEDHPDPSDEDIRVLCEAWVSYQSEVRDEEPDDDDPRYWAVEAVLEAAGPGREALLWRLIRCLCAHCSLDDDEAVGMIGVAPLESMIRWQGDRAMDLIEPEADRDSVLLQALSQVWAFHEPVRLRIDSYLARRGYPPREA